MNIFIINNGNTKYIKPTLNSNNQILEKYTYITNTKLSLIKFENKHITNIIRPLHVDKAHGHYHIRYCYR